MLLSADYCIILVNIMSMKIQSFPALHILLENKWLSFLCRLGYEQKKVIMSPQLTRNGIITFESSKKDLQSLYTLS